jgi:hypothetical protein
MTRARVELFTRLKSLMARDTVAVDTPAFLATAARLAAISGGFLPRFAIYPSLCRMVFCEYSTLQALARSDLEP